MENTQTLQLLNRQSHKSRLVFIDPKVEDYQSLIHGVLPNTEVVILDADSDGVEQISELLAQRSGITSLHIVSHGAPGRVYLGNTELGQHTLNHYAGQLMYWAEAFSRDAQILLYGCDVAQAESGKAFVHRLSELTSTTVLASDGLTGSTALGGDWELKVRTGKITTTVAFNPATLATYRAVLSEPYLVKDIDSFNDTFFATNANGILYFLNYFPPGNNDTDELNTRLWKSDGTKEGTVPLKDFKGSQYEFSSLNNTSINGILYFLYPFGDKSQLWKSNGTPESTVLVKDFDFGYFIIRNLSNVNNTLYFSIDKDYGYGDAELWKSDGTADGTVRVKEFSLPNEDSNIRIDNLTNVNNTLYFSAEGGLWKSDGTADGTVRVKDFSLPNEDSSNIRIDNLTNVNNTLYFSAEGRLWKSDGTADGTFLLKNVFVSTLRSVNGTTPVSNLINVNGTFYFISYSLSRRIYSPGLWKSDGTTEGTVLVKNIKLGIPDFNISELTNVNGILYFTVNDGIYNRELWKSDGTTEGTVLVKNINYASSLVNVNGTLYFTANDGIYGQELWKSDGTTEGTVLVKDLNSGAAGSNPRNLTYLNNILYFRADDGIYGRELWAIKTNDVINGNGSRDPLIGTDGSDRIVGGTGSKTITGGAGNDEFVYTSIREVGHRITDFTVGSDKIVLTEMLDSLANGGYNGSNAITNSYVRLIQGSTTNSTILQIDRDGLMGSAVFRPFIQLDNVTPQAMNNISNFVF